MRRKQIKFAQHVARTWAYLPLWQKARKDSLERAWQNFVREHKIGADDRAYPEET